MSKRSPFGLLMETLDVSNIVVLGCKPLVVLPGWTLFKAADNSTSKFGRHLIGNIHAGIRRVIVTADSGLFLSGGRRRNSAASLLL